MMIFFIIFFHSFFPYVKNYLEKHQPDITKSARHYQKIRQKNIQDMCRERYQHLSEDEINKK